MVITNHKATIVMSLEEKQNQLYHSQNNIELLKYYSQWAAEYDQDLVAQCQYIAPQKVAEVLLQFVPKDATILDAGAGTGLVGEILYQNGYSHLEAMDISAAMLEQARQKNVYDAFHQKVMGQPLGFKTDSFDAIVSVGVFTYGHAPSHSFDELLRITKPEGYIIFTLRLDFSENSDLKHKLMILEESNQWQLVKIGDSFCPLSTAKPEGHYRIWIYQVTP